MEMTVVFADLSSFTEMTGRLGATTTYSVVDEFLRLASTALMSHGAFIDKYIGDAVMALFNVPIKRADHAAAAVAASAKLQELLPGLSERLGVPFLGEVPLHMTIREKSDAGLPVVATEPDGEHARIYRDIATKVLAQLKGEAVSRGAPKIVIEA